MHIVGLDVFEDCITKQETMKKVYINLDTLLYIRPFFTTDNHLNSEIRLIDGIVFYSQYSPIELIRLLKHGRNLDETRSH